MKFPSPEKSKIVTMCCMDILVYLMVVMFPRVHQNIIYIKYMQLDKSFSTFSLILQEHPRPAQHPEGLACVRSRHPDMTYVTLPCAWGSILSPGKYQARSCLSVPHTCLPVVSPSASQSIAVSWTLRFSIKVRWTQGRGFMLQADAIKEE